MLTSRYASLATRPITEGDYAGPDVRYSSEFEEIEAALEQDGSIHSNGGPDWQQVVEQSEQLLNSQSKDLRVGCWLGWGLYRCDGINGLEAGVALVNGLLQHWDDLHPRKERTRAAAVGWFVNRLEAAMPELLACSPNATVLQQLHDGLNSLDQNLSRLLGDQAPLLQPICRQVRSLVDSSPPSAATTTKAPASLSAATTPAAPAQPTLASGTPSSVDAILSARDAHKALRSLQEQSRALCQWWQSQSVMDARAISLSRTALWLPIEALPEHDEAGKTGLRGLPADRLQAFQERLNHGHPAELLVDIENSIARAPFWIDGQQLAWRCLDELKADTAKRELEHQLSSFLSRLPGIENLQFFDGTPFANQQTLGWISSHLQSSTASNDLSNQITATDEPWDLSFGEAAELLRSHGLKAAMLPLQTGINSAHGGRARLHWQLATARLCLQAGKHELARNILEGLEQSLSNTQMTQWEPQLLVQVMRLLLKSHDLSGDKSTRQRRNEIFQRLCHLDFDVVLEQALGP